jgi:hypothetical protein
VERISSDSLGSLVRDQLDRLNDTVDNLPNVSLPSPHPMLENDITTHLVLNTRVLSLGVLTDQDSVDIVVSGLVSLDGDTWADVGKERECSAEGEVHRDVTLSDWTCVSDYLY